MLSLQKIRELNQLYLHVACCSDPAGRISMGSPDSGAMDQGAGVWSFGMFADGGTRLNAAIKGDPGPGGMNNVLNTTLGRWGATILREGWGVIPQLDYSRKFIFQGTDTVSLDFTCYLVLENDVVSDFFDPLIRLFFLTYPRRTTATLPDLAAQGVDSMSTAINRFNENVGALQQSWESQGKSGLALGAAIAGHFISGFGFTAEMLSTLVSTVANYVDDWTGGIYGMVAPPTFMSKLSGKLGVSAETLPNGVKLTYYPDVGSGLALSYGRLYVPNVYISSLSVQYPKLYYDGGYPQYLTVSLSFRTMRVATADMLYSAVTGQITNG